MKTILFIFIATLAATALPTSAVVPDACRQTAQQVVAALQKASPEEYTKLFPTLSEFHVVMDEYAYIYGETLPAAKEEFTTRYTHELLPAVKKSFAEVLQAGADKGIDWKKIEFKKVECLSPRQNRVPVSMTIVFSAGEKEYTVTVDKASVVEDAWRVTAKITLL